MTYDLIIDVKKGDPLELPVPVDPTRWHLAVYDAKIASIFDIKNLDLYMAYLKSIWFKNVDSISSLQEFIPFTSLNSLWIDDCGLKHLDGIDKLIARSISLSNNGIELSNEMDNVEALWNSRGRKSRNIGHLGIGGNKILGRTVHKTNYMPVAKTYFYIKEWIGRRS